MSTAKAVRTKHSKQLLRKSNVCGTGVGLKWVDGKPTKEPAVLVFVQKKLPADSVIRKFSAGDLIPDELDGIPTDVIEVGRIRKQAGFRSKIRPIRPGFSCGHPKITAGTIGGLFYDNNGSPVILSNNHVLANENNAQIGDIIYQPGPHDTQSNLTFAGWTSPANKLPYIATLKKFKKLTAAGNLHDSAVAQIHNSLVAQNLTDGHYPVVNRPTAGFGAVEIGQTVQKCGRTTGYTTGTVLGLHSTFTVEYDFGNATFDDCVVLTCMSSGGDSGSVIHDMSMNAVALLFAGSPKVTIANPISYVKDFYGLRIWDAEPHGDNVIVINDNNWRQFTTDGEILIANGKITFTDNANHFCFVQRPLQKDFREISCVINTGTDQGATWGPGLVVQWPTGQLKVHLRYAGVFGGAFNQTYNLSVGSVKPNTKYTVRIRKAVQTYIGEVKDGNQWYKVIEIPHTVLPGRPSVVRIGKTGLDGSTMNFAPPGSSDTGAVGVCSAESIAIV